MARSMEGLDMMRKTLRKAYPVFLSSLKVCVSTTIWLLCEDILRSSASMARSMEGLEIVKKRLRSYSMLMPPVRYA